MTDVIRKYSEIKTIYPFMVARSTKPKDRRFMVVNEL